LDGLAAIDGPLDFFGGVGVGVGHAQKITKRRNFTSFFSLFFSFL
jgi:hypothetical protein